MENIYEVSYLSLPHIAPEQISQKATSLKDSIVSLGGTIISDENPVLIPLAYEMIKVVGTVRHKVDSGYFGWVKFEIEADKINELKKSLDSNDDIIRYLIIKTVRENTLLNGKMKLQKEEKVRREEDVPVDVVDAEIPQEVVPADLDKSIDELVVV